MSWCHVQVVSTEKQAARFIILHSSELGLVFSHWKPFKDAGYPFVSEGQCFWVKVKEADLKCAIDEVDVVQEIICKSSMEYEEDEESIFNFENFFNSRDGRNGPIVIRGGRRASGIDVFGAQVERDLIICDATFDGNFRINNTNFKSNVVFINCLFKKHFSMKGCSVSGDVRALSCDFSGAGGVSFRGLTANALLIEYDTYGGEDMMWLNEMSIKDRLVLSGKFNAPVQIYGIQDGPEEALSDNPSIGRIQIGGNSYSNESLNKNVFISGLHVSGYKILGGFLLNGAYFYELSFDNLISPKLMLFECEIAKDLSIRTQNENSGSGNIEIKNSSVFRNLYCTDCLNGSVWKMIRSRVGGGWIFYSKDSVDIDTRVLIDDFWAQQASFKPIEMVYGGKRREGWFRPADFSMFFSDSYKEESGQKDNLSESYTLMKNWFAESGHLREEDIAYFHMRDAKEKSAFIRFFMGKIFGWGIRFRNIMFSAMLLVAFFASLFWIIGYSYLSAIVVSIQSFFGIFFGPWPEFPEVKVMQVLVTLESAIGVVFITVLVGCYLRKLLR